MKAPFLWIALAAGAAVAFVGCNSLTKMDYFCSECATSRRELQVRPFRMENQATLFARESSTSYTRIIRSIDPGLCVHRWEFSAGSGGFYG